MTCAAPGFSAQPTENDLAALAVRNSADHCGRLRTMVARGGCTGRWGDMLGDALRSPRCRPACGPDGHWLHEWGTCWKHGFQCQGRPAREPVVAVSVQARSGAERPLSVSRTKLRRYAASAVSSRCLAGFQFATLSGRSNRAPRRSGCWASSCQKYRSRLECGAENHFQSRMSARGATLVLDDRRGFGDAAVGTACWTVQVTWHKRGHQRGRPQAFSWARTACP